MNCKASGPYCPRCAEIRETERQEQIEIHKQYGGSPLARRLDHRLNMHADRRNCKSPGVAGLRVLEKFLERLPHRVVRLGEQSLPRSEHLVRHA